MEAPEHGEQPLAQASGVSLVSTSTPYIHAKAIIVDGTTM